MSQINQMCFWHFWSVRWRRINNVVVYRENFTIENIGIILLWSFIYDLCWHFVISVLATFPLLKFSPSASPESSGHEIEHGEINCQSWLLLTSFSNFPIVHWIWNSILSLLCDYGALVLWYVSLHTLPIGKEYLRWGMNAQRSCLFGPANIIYLSR